MADYLIYFYHFGKFIFILIVPAQNAACVEQMHILIFQLGQQHQAVVPM